MICAPSTPTNTMTEYNEPMECPPEEPPEVPAVGGVAEPHDLEREYEGPPGDLSLLSHEPQPQGDALAATRAPGHSHTIHVYTSIPRRHRWIHCVDRIYQACSRRECHM